MFNGDLRPAGKVCRILARRRECAELKMTNPKMKLKKNITKISAELRHTEANDFLSTTVSKETPKT